MTAPLLGNFIDGAPAPAPSAPVLDIVNPATEEIIARAPISGSTEVEAAYAAALRASAQWKRSTPSERQLALLRIADALERRADEFADLESLNAGKVRATLVEDEIAPSVDQLRFFAGAARDLEGSATAEYLPDHTSSIRREPIGVVGQVTPWNYPLNMLVWKVGPALAAGNTTVIKPSDTTPLTTRLFAELAAEFLPPGVLNVVLGDRTTGELLVSHPTPGLVSITGSVRAGKEVAAAGSRDLKRLHLELGGKAPVIVFDDADLDRAIEGICGAAFFNAGQDCTAATRLLVQEDIYTTFVERLVDYVEANVSTGDPQSPATTYGPVNNVRQFERLLSLFEAAPAHARILTGGTRIGDHGYFIAPTVIDGLRQDDDLIQTEIFGPVLTVQPFADDAQALEYANGVEYGLASSIWTRDHTRALRFQRDLDFGCVWVNTHIPITAEMPHGGFKHSGYGKDLSHYALEDYTRVKHVMSYIGD